MNTKEKIVGFELVKQIYNAFDQLHKYTYIYLAIIVHTLNT